MGGGKAARGNGEKRDERDGGNEGSRRNKDSQRNGGNEGSQGNEDNEDNGRCRGTGLPPEGFHDTGRHDVCPPAVRAVTPAVTPGGAGKSLSGGAGNRFRRRGRYAPP